MSLAPLKAAATLGPLSVAVALTAVYPSVTVELVDNAGATRIVHSSARLEVARAPTPPSFIDGNGEIVAELAPVWVGPAGQPGTGGGGTAGIQTFPAAVGVNGHRVVYIAADGARHVHHEDPDAADVALGISLNAAGPGDTVQIRTAGPLTESSWSWTVPGVIYCGNDGTLTQTAPDHGAVLEVGFALSPTSMQVRIVEPEFLNEMTEASA